MFQWTSWIKSQPNNPPYQGDQRQFLLIQKEQGSVTCQLAELFKQATEGTRCHLILSILQSLPATALSCPFCSCVVSVSFSGPRLYVIFNGSHLSSVHVLYLDISVTQGGNPSLTGRMVGGLKHILSTDLDLFKIKQTSICLNKLCLWVILEGIKTQVFFHQQQYTQKQKQKTINSDTFVLSQLSLRQISNDNGNDQPLTQCLQGPQRAQKLVNIGQRRKTSFLRKQTKQIQETSLPQIYMQVRSVIHSYCLLNHTSELSSQGACSTADIRAPEEGMSGKEGKRGCVSSSQCSDPTAHAQQGTGDLRDFCPRMVSTHGCLMARQ